MFGYFSILGNGFYLLIFAHCPLKSNWNNFTQYDFSMPAQFISSLKKCLPNAFHSSFIDIILWNFWDLQAELKLYWSLLMAKDWKWSQTFHASQNNSNRYLTISKLPQDPTLFCHIQHFNCCWGVHRLWKYDGMWRNGGWPRSKDSILSKTSIVVSDLRRLESFKVFLWAGSSYYVWVHCNLAY